MEKGLSLTINSSPLELLAATDSQHPQSPSLLCNHILSMTRLLLERLQAAGSDSNLQMQGLHWRMPRSLQLLMRLVREPGKAWTI